VFRYRASGTIFGCNALYREFDKYDYLVSIDKTFQTIIEANDEVFGKDDRIIFPPPDECWEDLEYSPNRRRSNAGMNAMLEAIERGYFGDNPLRVYAETLRSARGWSRRNLALVFIRRDRRHEHGTFNGAPYTVCVETYRAWICSPLIEDVVEITGDLEKLNFDVLRVIFSKCLDR